MFFFSLKEIFAKKKAFSVSICTDEEIVQIQSDVTSILKDLDDDATHIDEKDSYGEQLEKIDTLLTAVGTTSTRTCPSEAKILMGDEDMETLIDDILGVDIESSVQTNQAETDLDSTSQLDVFEQIIARMELSAETDDLFEDDAPSSNDSLQANFKLFPVFIKGATEKNQRCAVC